MLEEPVEAPGEYKNILLAHDKRVQTLAARVKQFYDKKVPFRLYHGNTNSTRPSTRSFAQSLDVSHLDHILFIDKERKTCTVEPNLSMGALVDATLEQNLVPLVVPEFPGITVGGAFAGTAGESSSWKHGFFDATVNWCEVILADHSVKRCSADENPDLFRGLKGTFGTLGVGTLFEIQLVEASEYVELTYHTISKGITEAKKKISELCMQPESLDFVDGIMFAKPDGVVVSGRILHTSDYESKLQRTSFHKPWDDWFYVHAEEVRNKMLSQSSASSIKLYQELVPIRSYLFRYDRGGFWTGRHAYHYFLTPFNRVTRYLLDGFMHTRTMYHALHRSGLMHQFIIQDMALPWKNIEPFYDWIDQKVNIYPQWLCPLRIQDLSIGLRPRNMPSNNEAEAQKLDTGAGMMLNIGVWGPSPGHPITVNRAIEQKLEELQGLKWLYAQTYYTEEEFWRIYDHKAYEDMRRTYRAETLPDIYIKVGGPGANISEGLRGIWGIWPFAGLYGVLSCLKGGDYLRKS